MQINKIQEQIKKKEKEIELLNKQLKEITDTSEWITIPEKGIQIQKSIHHKNNTLREALKDIKKGEFLPSYELLQGLRNNSKYCKLLGLNDTWEFVEQPDEISKKNGYVARFYAGSDYCGLNCDAGASDSGSNLGVRFVRKISKKVKA